MAQSVELPDVPELSARGRVSEVSEKMVVFNPLGTTYKLHLVPVGDARPAAGKEVAGIVRAAGGKVWTVPSGGAFIVPISGPPRIIQGRIRKLSTSEMVVSVAGIPVVVKLPAQKTGYDLARGPLRVGGMVNVVAEPGATIEIT